MSENANPVGRPTLYQSQYCDQAYKLCLLGATDKELADFFSICEATLNNWKIEHPEFMESIKRGKDQADAEVADKLFKRATGYEHEAVKIFANTTTGQIIEAKYIEHYPPETAAMIFWLKNRQRGKWVDRVDQVHTGPNGGPIKTENVHLTPEEAARTYQDLLKDAQ